MLIIPVIFGKLSVDHGINITEKKTSINIQLKKKAPEQYVLLATSYVKDNPLQSNIWPLDYEAFRLDTGDVNKDGSTDILVGVIKKTRFDSICRKRLFIFKLVDGFIRPLWLGSRVSQPLEDFRFCKSHGLGLIRTIEHERDNSFLVAEYQWQGFGLSFIKYLEREVSFKRAAQLLNTN